MAPLVGCAHASRFRCRSLVGDCRSLCERLLHHHSTMTIQTTLSHDTLLTLIKSLRNVQEASNGYYIPVIGHRKTGRIHIVFSSEGLEVHRDIIVRGVHRVMSRSASAPAIYTYLKSRIDELTTGVLQ